MTFAIEQIAQESKGIGYRDDAILRDYAFCEVAGEQAGRTRSAPLAVFTQTPPSYRSAAFGAAESCAQGPEATVRLHRSLGAPLFFVIEEDEVSVWQVYAEGPPREIQRTPFDGLASLFQTHRDVWSPDAIHRAKSIGRLDTSYQLDFVDVGLIPALEGEIHEKLDRLLNDALASTRGASDDVIARLLFQGVFRLLAAKVLIDRGHRFSRDWDTSDVSSILYNISSYYGLPSEYFDNSAITSDLDKAWSILSRGLNVANISADDLAFVYENTLVTPETRRSYGTHSTPRHVAEYIVQRLGLWSHGEDPPAVFEPYAGAGVFLVSALRHMREALPADWNDKQRHDLLVRKIYGTEVDAFACEVATLSLILADYPNTNGWKIENTDLFRDNALENRLATAEIVLCNPPFEVFTRNERAAYPVASSRSGSKAMSVLSATLDAKPAAIGFVLPRTFLMDRSYKDQRKAIENCYHEIELVSLPDGVFSVSQVESALLIASDRRSATTSRRILSSEVDDSDKREFVYTGLPTRTREELRTPNDAVTGDLWIPPLRSLWKRLESSTTIGDYFTGHWGIRWLEGRQSTAGAEGPGKHTRLGLLRVQNHHQFCLSAPRWIDVRPETLYAGGRLPWDKPKILCNAARMSRGYWRLAAAVDHSGLVASQQFVGLWPKPDTENMDLDAFAAVLNGPIANAFITDHSTEKRFRIGAILSIPVPAQIPEVVGELAREYAAIIGKNEHRASDTTQAALLLDEIDRVLLDAYDIPPRLVRSLLAAFDSSERPIVHDWQSWNVREDDPAVTLTELRQKVLDYTRGDWVQRKLSPVSGDEAAKAGPYLS